MELKKRLTISAKINKDVIFKSAVVMFCDHANDMTPVAVFRSHQVRVMFAICLSVRYSPPLLALLCVQQLSTCSCQLIRPALSLPSCFCSTALLQHPPPPDYPPVTACVASTATVILPTRHRTTWISRSQRIRLSPTQGTTDPDSKLILKL